MRKDELKTVLLKFDDMLSAAGGGVPDDSSDDEEHATLPVGRGRGLGRGQGCGRSGHGDAAGKAVRHPSAGSHGAGRAPRAVH